VRIGVFGHVGNQNLGDEALVAAVIQNVRRLCPTAEVVGFAGRPSDTRERHNVEAFPIRRTNGRSHAVTSESGGAPLTAPSLATRARAMLKRVPFVRQIVRGARAVGRAVAAIPAEVGFVARAYRNLRDIDLLLVAGSGQLNDYWAGPWGFPYTLLKWALLTRCTGTKLAFLSLGAGPLTTRLGRFFIKQTLTLADYHSYRDEDSRRLIASLAIPGDHPVVPDLVFSLDIARPVPPRVARGRRVVGINPMPCFDDSYYPESDPLVFGTYAHTLAAFADWLVARDYTVRWFGTQLIADHPMIDRVRAMMREGGRTERVIADPIGSFEQLIGVLDSMDFVVATRYHGSLLSLVRQKPVLTIAYHPKSLELMRQVGEGAYGLDIKQLTLPALQQRFVALEEHAGDFVATVGEQLPAIRTALQGQYQRALELVPSPGRPSP
jgi:polysaccharide pyruvyl transferase WcaK-like protein